MASAASAVWSNVRKTGIAVVLLWLAFATRLASAQTPLFPSALAYDASGNLFFVDTARNQVFEVALSGALTVVAGNGTQGFSGDDGAAINAELNAPQGLTVGTDGTIYIADTGNQRIRAVDLQGIVTTIAGNGSRGFSGDNAAAINAELDTPTALAVDSENALLLCDTGNQRVRRIANGIIATVAGSGVQGFSGDTDPATTAELDSPNGIIVTQDGRILIADTQNQRIRSVSASGIITTIAGIGSAGFSGDGGPAIAAQLSLPQGLAIDSSGDILVADSGNQRLRSINPQGIIATIAGSGVQGLSQDAAVAAMSPLNTPRGVAVSTFGVVTFTDTSNQLVREIAANGELLTIAPAPGTRTDSVELSVPATATYGQGAATVTVQSNATQPLGTVTILDGTTTIATAVLTNGIASISLGPLSAGKHNLIATYAGDGLNPAASSAGSALEISPAIMTVIANGATIAYGQPIPPLSGTVTGILPQDASLVVVAFGTSAASLSPVGSYPITASLTGPASGNYDMTLGHGSGSLQITQAQTSVTMAPVAAQSYTGLPLPLTASVRSTTSATPTGEVDFEDGTVIVAKADCVNGTASAVDTLPSAGAHSLSAVYVGDANFLGSSSSSVATSIVAMPDFGIASSSPSQTIQAGLVAEYPLAITPLGGPFTGSVTFSVSGLPVGAMASFSPATIVPGATSATVEMSVQISALAQLAHPRQRHTPVLWVFCLPIGIGLSRRRKRWSSLCGLLALSFFLTAALGCGARTIGDGVGALQSSQLTVTATSTNLAGTVVSHSVLATLLVQ